MNRRRFQQLAGLAALGTITATRGHKTPARAEDPKGAFPFTIRIAEPILTDLAARLAHTRLPDQIPGAGWDYGVELEFMRRLLDHWRTKFDWRREERKLNAFDQFLVEIDDLQVHCIHVRSKEKDALPLVITHGWPGSICEFTKIIGRLADPVAHGGKASDAFHVVCPSMPGYGFSQKPARRGYSRDQVSRAVATLMARLGYSRYGAQGGDIGAQVSNQLGVHDAKHVVGVHLTWTPVAPPAKLTDVWEGVTADEKARYETRRQELSSHGAYAAIQATRPQTIGYGLNDSPAGLAAWIIDKFHIWSDCNGDVLTKFSMDELLTNVMVYWVTGTITSSFRLYFEGGSWPTPRVPIGVAQFPKEITVPPRKWVETRFPVRHWTTMPRGGHFAALEEPDLLVADIRKFFRALR